MTIKVRVRVSENNEGTLEEFMILTVIGNDMPDIVNQCKQATDYIKTDLRKGQMLVTRSFRTGSSLF